MKLRPRSQGEKPHESIRPADARRRLCPQAASDRGLDAEGETAARADLIELDPILAASLSRAQRQDFNIQVLIFGLPGLQDSAVAIETKCAVEQPCYAGPTYRGFSY